MPNEYEEPEASTRGMSSDKISGDISLQLDDYSRLNKAFSDTLDTLAQKIEPVMGPNINEGGIGQNKESELVPLAEEIKSRNNILCHNIDILVKIIDRISI